MEILNYVLAIIFSFFGIFAGMLLGYIAKEELRAGKKYFVWMQNILLILGLFFILVVSKRTEIIIDERGLLITTTTLFLMKRKDRLNFKDMNSIDIKEGPEKSLVYFMKGWRGRKVLIDIVDLIKLIDYIKSENPDLIK